MTGDHSPHAAGGWRAYLGLSDDDLLAQCEVDRFRASGPGGQKRNKTDSAVRLRHRPTGLESVAVESRSQHENRARALRRLRLTIALASREAVDLDGYEPSGAIAGRMRGQRIEIATKNPAYPDTLYVDELIGPHTVNTLPDATLAAFEDHGTVARTIDEGLDEAHRVIDGIAAAGVDLTDVGTVLENEGVAAFEKSFTELLDTLDAQAR